MRPLCVYDKVGNEPAARLWDGVERNMAIVEAVGTNVKVGCWHQIVRVVHVKVVAQLKPIRISNKQTTQIPGG